MSDLPFPFNLLAEVKLRYSLDWSKCAYCGREAISWCEKCERSLCVKHEVIWNGSFCYCRNCYVELRMNGTILPDELDEGPEDEQ